MSDQRPGIALSDPLEAEARKMTDAELRERIEAIRGNPKRAGSRARRLSMGESLAVATLIAEQAIRRVPTAPPAPSAPGPVGIPGAVGTPGPQGTNAHYYAGRKQARRDV